jgi:putative ABC transport system substrate-binding protein
MDRRRLLALLACAALAGMTPASAQPQGVPTIGVLVLGSPPPEPFIQALREGLREAGYVEGRNIRLEVRSAGGRTDRLAGAAAELVALNVDAIVSFQTPAAIAAKQATATIPIVMSGAGDPVGSGLVATMARPGGNVTGTSAGGVEIAGKSVELVRELFPAARRIAVLANEIDPFTAAYLTEIARTAGIARLETERIMTRPGAPLAPAFDEIRAKGVDAVIVQGSVLTREAVELATRHRLPSWSTVRMLPISGGLMSYAARFSDLHREAAVYVDKILKGAKPADLPVGFPSKFELVLNLKAARDLGVTIPETFLLRADELIE